MRKNIMVRLILSFNILGVILFLLPQLIVTAGMIYMGSALELGMRETVGLLGYMYKALPVNILIAGLLIFAISIVGIFGTFKDKKWGKLLLAISTIIYLVNVMGDFMQADVANKLAGLIINPIILLMIYWLVGKAKLFQIAPTISLNSKE
ncbi:MAG: hypothetical protein Q7S37_00370 [bacterium]|nr:hypothetical protein [bacterium]